VRGHDLETRIERWPTGRGPDELFGRLSLVRLSGNAKENPPAMAGQRAQQRHRGLRRVGGSGRDHPPTLASTAVTLIVNHLVQVASRRTTFLERRPALR
jgi:hypothetical protein